MVEPLKSKIVFFSATFFTSPISASSITSTTSLVVSDVPITLVAFTVTFCFPAARHFTVIVASVRLPAVSCNDEGSTHSYALGLPVPLAVMVTSSPTTA